MLDHIGIRVRDLARSTEFYLAVLKPLGYGIVMQVSAEQSGNGGAVGFGADGKPSFWISGSTMRSGPLHIAFAASSRADIDAFYRLAIAAGAKDHGPPGLRPEYHADYYAAFVLDPDGNNIEAVSHAPA